MIRVTAAATIYVPLQVRRSAIGIVLSVAELACLGPADV